MKSLLLLFVILLNVSAEAQLPGYKDSLKNFQQNYVINHEVVKEADRKYFKFYPVSEKYHVLATFKKLTDAKGFVMKTSGKELKKYFKYGKLNFTLDGKLHELTVYQSEKLMANEQYKDYLFVPFTDLTSGNKSYGGGRYLDFLISDIKDNKLLMDFNKAYNPYCAYTTGFNCPIPPRENDLPLAIKAGEMEFGKGH
ncbi:MAG: DUF1684 domain-containing protein [Ferruginibacter sp.]